MVNSYGKYTVRPMDATSVRTFDVTRVHEKEKNCLVATQIFLEFSPLKLGFHDPI